MKKLSECPKYEVSPFHNGDLATLGLRRFPLAPKGPLINAENGEVIKGGVYLNRQFGYLDDLENVKLFKNVASTLANLSPPGIKMFFYIVANLNKGQEKVYIAPQSALKFTGYSSNKDVYKGIFELVTCEVLARSSEHLMYFVNPNILFVGNKVDLLK